MYCEKDDYQCLSQIIVKENKYYEFQQGKKYNSSNEDADCNITVVNV